MGKREPFKCAVCGRYRDRVYKALNKNKKQVYICYRCVNKRKESKDGGEKN